jgi:hypothetical protein
MTTTENPATPLPFLLPAANLAVGDTLYSGAVIDARETAPGGKVHVTLMDGTVLEPMDPDELVEVTNRRPAAAVLNDVVTALTDLADLWEQTIQSLDQTKDRARQACNEITAERADAGSTWLKGCAAEVRVILARLQ